MSKKFFEIEIDPNFDEIDPYGIVHHKNFFSWFERGRFKLAEHLGVFETIMESDYKVLVLEAQCNYKNPVKFHDKLLLRIFIDSLEGPLIFNYELYRKLDFTLVASGKTKHAFLKETKLMAKVPGELRIKLEEFYENKKH